MTAWFLNPFLCIDTETTGVDVFNDRIVEVASVLVMPDGEAVDGWSVIVDPGVEVPDGAAQIHGITTTRAAAEGIEPKAALDEIARRIYEHIDTWGLTGAPIVIYNAPFDLTLLLAEAERHGVDLPVFAPYLDPLLIDRMVNLRKKVGAHKLVSAAAHYGVPLSDEDAHGGLADATASGRVMRALCERYPKITDHSLATLWLRQVKGAERDRLSLVDYMRRNRDPDFDKAPGWPVLASV